MRMQQTRRSMSQTRRQTRAHAVELPGTDDQERCTARTTAIGTMAAYLRRLHDLRSGRLRAGHSHHRRPSRLAQAAEAWPGSSQQSRPLPAGEERLRCADVAGRTWLQVAVRFPNQS